MKMQFSLFYAVIATVGVVNSSKDVIESNTQLRSLKDRKGGGGKGGKKEKATTKNKEKEPKKLLKAKKPKKLKGQKAPKAPETTECLYFSNGKSKKGKRTQKRRVGRIYFSNGKSKKGKRTQKRRVGRVLHRQRFVGRVGKKSKATSGTSCDVDLSNNWGQKPGSCVVITSYDNIFNCIQPSSLSEGASLESVPCSYDKSDIFKVDKYGRLHTSDRSLCVTADDGSLVLDDCNERTPNSIFLYNEETKMISLFDDPNQVISLQDGKLFLMAPLLGTDGKNEDISQKWSVVLNSGCAPSSTPPTSNPTAPNAPDVPPTLSPAPSSS